MYVHSRIECDPLPVCHRKEGHPKSNLPPTDFGSIWHRSLPGILEFAPQHPAIPALAGARIGIGAVRLHAKEVSLEPRQPDARPIGTCRNQKYVSCNLNCRYDVVRLNQVGRS
jgi:hypothetical protein